MKFDETKHPRDDDGKFTDGNATSERDKRVAAIRKYSDEPSKDMQDLPQKKQRIKVAEITSPIYDDMVLSNGRSVKDIVTRAVEMPLTGPAGVEHIEEHSERKGMVNEYIGVMSDIINDPDYVFEDKTHENTLQIEKKIDAHTIMTVKLNFDNPKYTNTVITMRNEGEDSFDRTLKSYEKSKKVLYKKQKS